MNDGSVQNDNVTAHFTVIRETTVRKGRSSDEPGRLIVKKRR